MSREQAKDPATAPDVLARLAARFPDQVAANPSTPIHVLIERSMRRHHLPSVYANPIWPLFALENPVAWIDQYRASLDTAWLELGQAQLSWSQKLLLCAQFAEHGLSLVDAEHLSTVQEAIEAVREMAAFGSGPRDFDRFLGRFTQARHRLGRGSRPSSEAARAIFFASQFVESADTVRYGISWKHPNSTIEMLEELHWQAVQVMAVLGYKE